VLTDPKTLISFFLYKDMIKWIIEKN
jgi:hypothetical protein